MQNHKIVPPASVSQWLDVASPHLVSSPLRFDSELSVRTQEDTAGAVVPLSVHDFQRLSTTVETSSVFGLSQFAASISSASPPWYLCLSSLGAAKIASGRDRLSVAEVSSQCLLSEMRYAADDLFASGTIWLVADPSQRTLSWSSTVDAEWPSCQTVGESVSCALSSSHSLHSSRRIVPLLAISCWEASIIEYALEHLSSDTAPWHRLNPDDVKARYLQYCVTNLNWRFALQNLKSTEGNVSADEFCRYTSKL